MCAALAADAPQLFHGKFRFCNDSSVAGKEECVGTFSHDGQVCWCALPAALREPYAGLNTHAPRATQTHTKLHRTAGPAGGRACVVKPALHL